MMLVIEHFQKKKSPKDSLLKQTLANLSAEVLINKSDKIRPRTVLLNVPELVRNDSFTGSCSFIILLSTWHKLCEFWHSAERTPTGKFAEVEECFQKTAFPWSEREIITLFFPCLSALAA